MYQLTTVIYISKDRDINIYITMVAPCLGLVRLPGAHGMNFSGWIMHRVHDDMEHCSITDTVSEIHWPQVDFLHKGPGMRILICSCIVIPNDQVAGDVKRHGVHVTSL